MQTDKYSESARLKELEKYNIMDTPPEQEFDDIAELASKICNTPISIVSFIDMNRQWYKAKKGLENNEVSRNVAFCDYAIKSDNVMVVEDAKKDDRFKDNPFVVNNPNIRFYAGVPLTTSNGYNLGTLCVIDMKPKVLNKEQEFALKVLGKQVIAQVELRKMVHNLEKANDEVSLKNTEFAKINDTNSKLLTIIAHDLKSPLASLQSSLDMYDEKVLSPEEMVEVTHHVRQKLAKTNELLDNLLNWAVSQFIHEKVDIQKFNLSDLIKSVIKNSESLIASKNNSVINNVDAKVEIVNERNIIKFVLRNLLINANKFTKNGEIKFEAVENDNEVTIFVSDTGSGMDKEQVSVLFDWNKRKSTPGTDGEIGSGLGLQVCNDMVKKLGGKITVESALGKGSKFSVVIPKE